MPYTAFAGKQQKETASSVYPSWKCLRVIISGSGKQQKETTTLTLTVKMRVGPEPGFHRELLGLMRRYRDALNHSIKVIIESGALSLGKAHRLLYSTLREEFGLPSRAAQDCYREALAIAKSWLRR